jgi:hypothetical protein
MGRVCEVRFREQQDRAKLRGQAIRGAVGIPVLPRDPGQLAPALHDISPAQGCPIRLRGRAAIAASALALRELVMSRNDTKFYIDGE